MHRRGVIRAFFVALILFFWGAKNLPDSFLRFVAHKYASEAYSKKKLAQLCKRSLADALEKR